MIKCIVFDFDGTLVPSNEVKKTAYFRVFQDYPRAPAVIEKILEDMQAHDRNQIIRRIMMELDLSRNSPEAIDAAVKRYVEAYGAFCESAIKELQENAGATDCLRYFSGRFTLYINSMTPAESLERLVEARAWHHYFKKTLGSRCSKLNNLRAILKEENIQTHQLLFIGDGKQDLEAARMAGCHFLGFSNTDGELDGENVPTIRNFDSLHSFLAELK